MSLPLTRTISSKSLSINPHSGPHATSPETSRKKRISIGQVSSLRRNSENAGDEIVDRVSRKGERT